MRIRFETTIEDVIAFNRFHFANSPAWRRQVRTQMLMVPAGLIAILLLFYLMRDPVGDFDLILWSNSILFAVISIAWMIFIRRHMNWTLERNARKLLAEGSNRIMFGWRDMELAGGRLHLKTDLIESSLDLRAIEKIVSDGQYTFVYIASVSAYMIPMDLYPEDEYRAFVAELREAWENRDAPRPPDDDDAQSAPADVRIVERPH